MEYIKRPKKVQRTEKGYLEEKKYQDYAESQFKTIYDKFDETVDVVNSGFQGEPGPVGPPGPERTRRTCRTRTESQVKMVLMEKMA